MLPGEEQAITALEDFSKKKLRAAIRKGSRAGCKVIQAQARQTAPHRTGALAAGMKVRALPRSRKYVGTQVTLGVYYAAFIEYGLKNRHLVARHYMKNAANQEKVSALNTARDVIKQELNAS